MKIVMVMLVMALMGGEAQAQGQVRQAKSEGEFDRVGSVSAVSKTPQRLPRGVKGLPGGGRPATAASTVDARKAEFVRRMFWVAMLMR